MSRHLLFWDSSEEKIVDQNGPVNNHIELTAPVELHNHEFYLILIIAIACVAQLLTAWFGLYKKQLKKKYTSQNV